MSVLVGIPALNVESTIEEVVVKANQYADNVLVVNDGSTDKTSDIMQKLDITIITHDRKRGYGAALQSIFTHAKKTMNEQDILVILDSDGQHNPDDIARLCEPIRNGAVDIVTGTRFQNSKLPIFRKIVIKCLTKLVNGNIEDGQCGFRAYNYDAVINLNLHELSWGISLEILREAKKKQLRIAEVPITCIYDQKSHSSNPISQGSSLVESFLWFMVFGKPLTILGIPALLILVGSFISASITIYLYMTLQYLVLGWALITISCLIVGMLLAFSAILFYALSRRFPYE